MTPRDSQAALEEFLAESKRLHETMREPLRKARFWAWFWFTCWAISVVSRLWDAW